MNENNYPLTNLLPIGTRVRVTYVSSYEDAVEVGEEGTIESHDEYDSTRPYQVRVGRNLVWANAVALDAPTVEISSRELTDVLTRNGATAQLAVELLALLDSKGIKVRFNA